MIHRVPLRRPSPGRRSARLFLIATEGERTEPLYFEALAVNGVFDRLRTTVVVLPPQDDGSAIKHVYSRLAAACEGEKLARSWVEGLDEAWVVADLDRLNKHPEEQKPLSEIAAEARQKGFQLAWSNPCFEVWLCLHFTHAVDACTDAAASLARLQELRPGAGKKNLRPEWFPRSAVEAAIRHAKALDTQPQHRWPQSVGSHMHRLATSLLEGHGGR